MPGQVYWCSAVLLIQQATGDYAVIVQQLLCTSSTLVVEHKAPPMQMLCAGCSVLAPCYLQYQHVHLRFWPAK